MNYSLNQKMEVINYLIKNEASLYNAEKKFNISRESIRIWLYKYKNDGMRSLENSKKKSKHTGQFKVDVVEYMHEHRYSYKKTSIIFNITPSALKEWDLIYRYEGKDVLLKGNYMGRYKKKHLKLEDKSKEELMEEIEQLRMENAYLKKLRALIQKGTKPNNGKK